MGIFGTSTRLLRQGVFLSLFDGCRPFLRSLRARRFLLRLLLGNPLGMRRSASIALRAIQQLFDFRVGNLRLAELRYGLHLSGVELAIRPGALLAKNSSELSGRVGDFVHVEVQIRIYQGSFLQHVLTQKGTCQKHVKSVVSNHYGKKVFL